MNVKSFSLLGYPKCGNTWIHHVLWRAFGGHWNDIFHSHAMPNFNDRTWREARYDFSPHLENKTVVMTRHLGDVLVSLWMHMTYRDFPPTFHGTIDDIVEDPVYGVMKYLRFHQLLAGLMEADPKNFFVIRYTDIRKDDSVFLDMFRFIGFNNDMKISQAIGQSRFERMRGLEEHGAYNMPTLSMRPRASVTRDSFKVRKGLVGGYLNYFSDWNMDIIHDAMREMPAVYGFTDDRIFLKRRAI